MDHLTESPIEADMLCALTTVRPGGVVLPRASVKELAKRAFDNPGIVVVAPQVSLGRYRADFMVAFGSKVMAIECDGAEWHGSTIEQMRHDKKRDQYFENLHIKVMRFGGSFIRRDVYKCAHMAISELTGEDTRAGDAKSFPAVLVRVMNGVVRRFPEEAA